MILYHRVNVLIDLKFNTNVTLDFSLLQLIIIYYFDRFILFIFRNLDDVRVKQLI